jgi:hypothetical protein
MISQTSDEQARKRAIFDTMSARRQKHILRRGYDRWDPFEEPKDPIDIRKDKTGRTSQALIREFIQSRLGESLGNEYTRGAFDLCLGIINEDQRYLGMFDFFCWYSQLLKKEGHR